MTRFAIVAVALFGLSLTTGCTGRLISEGVSVATGPAGVVREIKPLTENFDNRYYNLRVEAFRDETFITVPQSIQDSLADYVSRDVATFYAKRKIPLDPAAPTLTIKGVYMYYEDADRVVDQVFGPFEELVTHVWLYNGKRLLGEAFCVGRSTTSYQKGADAKAQGLAKAIGDWVARGYPKK